MDVPDLPGSLIRGSRQKTEEPPHSVVNTQNKAVRNKAERGSWTKDNVKMNSTCVEKQEVKNQIRDAGAESYPEVRQGKSAWAEGVVKNSKRKIEEVDADKERRLVHVDEYLLPFFRLDCAVDHGDKNEPPN